MKITWTKCALYAVCVKITRWAQFCYFAKVLCSSFWSAFFLLTFLAQCSGQKLLELMPFNRIDKLKSKTHNEFIRCFHQFVSLFVFTKFSQFEQLKKKTNFLLVQNSFFSQFASWKRNHNKYSLKNFKLLFCNRLIIASINQSITTDSHLIKEACNCSRCLHQSFRRPSSIFKMKTK